jgi:hypothetical protein
MCKENTEKIEKITSHLDAHIQHMQQTGGKRAAPATAALGRAARGRRRVGLGDALNRGGDALTSGPAGGCGTNAESGSYPSSTSARSHYVKTYNRSRNIGWNEGCVGLGIGRKIPFGWRGRRLRGKTTR